jgi:hypothetical protein
MHTVSRQLVNDYVLVHPLAVSQSTVGEMLNIEAVTGMTPAKPSVQSTDTACTFLALLVADRVMRSVNSATSLTLAEITTDVILQFTPLPIMRSSANMYGVDEAYKILRAADACKPCSFQMPIYATVRKTATVAKQELQMALQSILSTNEKATICALYVSPPHTFLLCSQSDGPLVHVDTHMVSEVHGGSNTAALVSALHCMLMRQFLLSVLGYLVA